MRYESIAADAQQAYEQLLVMTADMARVQEKIGQIRARDPQLTPAKAHALQRAERATSYLASLLVEETARISIILDDLDVLDHD